MALPFEFYVASRYMVARRKQASIASTSLIAIVGVTVGVASLIIALALMTGLQREMRDRIVGSQAHVYVWKVLGGGFDDYRAEARTLEAVEGVAAAAPAIQGKALARTRVGEVFVNIKGIDPELEARVTEVADAVTQGSLGDVVSAGEDAFGGIVIGKGVAERLGAFVGDEIVLVTQSGTLSPMGVLPRPRRLEVVGIFDLGLFEYDTSFGFVSLETAARLFGRETVEMMQLRVDDIYASREVADRITTELGAGYLTDDWSQLNAALFSALWLEKMAISIAIGLIVVVSALHIVASLTMLVMEKSRDIAILKTMGAGAAAIRRVFVLQGGIIGLVGTAAGAGLGWAIATVMDRYRLLELPGDVYQISYVPFVIQPLDFALVVAAANLICFSATIYPSRHASRVDPAESLRYE